LHQSQSTGKLPANYQPVRSRLLKSNDFNSYEEPNKKPDLDAHLKKIEAFCERDINTCNAVTSVAQLWARRIRARRMRRTSLWMKSI